MSIVVSIARAHGGTARISARPEGGLHIYRAVPGHGRNLVATLTRTRSRPRGYHSVQFSTRFGTEFARLSTRMTP